MRSKTTIKDYLYQNLAPQSAENYLYTITNFLKLHPKAKRYKYQQLVDHLADVRQKYPNVQTCIRILSALKKYYDFLVATGQRTDHPCQKLTLKKGSDQSMQHQELFTIKELGMLMKRENRYRHLDGRNKVLISLMIYQGLTSDELIRLEVKNIDLDSGKVYVKASSKLERRTLPLDGSQILLLERYINETRLKLKRCTTEKLILTKLGKPITVDSINAMVEPLGSLFPDRKLNPRAIRMSVISSCFNEKKMRLEDVQAFAGHKWPGTTEKYLKKDSLQQREMINRFFPL